MANITARKNVSRQEGKILSYPVEESTTIYEGALVAVNAAGYAVNASDTSGERVVGVANETVDNSSGADGDLSIEVWTEGVIDLAAGFSATQANVGDKVYASDNQTVDLAGNLTNDILVGVIVEVVSASALRVKLDTVG